MTDEIRKAASSIFETAPEDLKYRKYDHPNLVDVMAHAIREDRKRRDDLESMLVELANNCDVVTLFKSSPCEELWCWEISCGHTSAGAGTTPTEAARAALDELKERGDA